MNRTSGNGKKYAVVGIASGLMGLGLGIMYGQYHYEPVRIANMNVDPKGPRVIQVYSRDINQNLRAKEFYELDSGEFGTEREFWQQERREGRITELNK